MQLVYICKIIGGYLTAPINRMIYFIQLKRKLNGIVSFPFSASISREASFEGCNAISAHSYFSGKMGYGTYIACNSSVEANIGRFCAIGPNVQVSRFIHPLTYPYVTISPMFFSMKHQNGYTFAKHQSFEEEKPFVEIGNDVWICKNSILMGGLHIGDGAIVCAGAVVTKNIPPYAIVGGIPARIIKYRYSQEDINFLMKLKWWEQPTEWLANNWELLNDIKRLKEKFQSE